jgi:predicted enzyme related to lactoylglutathione lyase
MRLTINEITIDCVDPKRQAEFWSEALGWDINNGGDWDAEITLGDQVVQANESWSSITSGLPDLPYVVFEKVPEPKTVKNRFHFCLKADDMSSEVSRLVGLGAFVVEKRGRVVAGREDRGEDVWTTMKDPEGNEFCLG